MRPARSSSGRTSFTFEPDPDQNFNREFTDYFVNGRKDDIGAFDTPKTPGRAIGWVTQVGDKWFEIEASDKATELHNGDGLCYYDLQKELVGVHINRAECMHAKKGIWRVFPKNEIAEFKDLRKGLEINHNRDMDWCVRWRKIQRTPYRPGPSSRDGEGLCTATDRRRRLCRLCRDRQRASGRNRCSQGRNHAARAAGPLAPRFLRFMILRST